ncbi:MAG: hypothetical protein U1F43_13435 [Myxococcota bacterium]
MTAAAPHLSDDRIRLRVLDAIRELKGPFTVPDLVAKTGLPPYEAEAALSQVVKDYRSDLDVDEQGNLVYRFDPELAAREDIVKADRARRRKEAFKRGLIGFFKAWTVAMVIIYFILYLVLLIAALVAAASAKGDSKSSSSSRGRSSGGGSWGTWGWGGWWGSTSYGGYGSYATRRDANRRNAETEGKLRRGEDPYNMRTSSADQKPSLKERTWYYLFGAKGIERNPLEREKELLTYLRAKKGLITNADIIALLGVTYEEADAIGTRLVATYDGEMDLTDSAVAIYRFPNLMVTGAPEVQMQTARLGYLWQVRRQEQVLRDNPSKVVPVLNFVNIILAFVTWGFVMPILHIEGIAAFIGLIVFPLTFSLIFFTLGFTRKLREAKNAERYQRDSIRIAMMQLLFTRRTPIKLPQDQTALGEFGLGRWSAGELSKVAGSVAAELRGEADETPSGTTIIAAQRVLEELSTVERLRQKADSARPVGRTVFTTRAIAGASPIGDVPLPGAPSGGKDEALAAQIAELEKELS